MEKGRDVEIETVEFQSQILRKEQGLRSSRCRRHRKRAPIISADICHTCLRRRPDRYVQSVEPGG
jgi:hypothetical protein